MNRGVFLVVAGILLGYVMGGLTTISLSWVVLASCLSLVLISWIKRPAVDLETNLLERDHLDYEMTRARRFGRSLALIVIRPAANTTIPDAAHRSIYHALGARRIDRLWMDGERMFVLLPETDRNGAETVIRRIEAGFATGSIRATSAIFPIDAVTSDKLMEAALQGSNDRDPVRAPAPADSSG